MIFRGENISARAGACLLWAAGLVGGCTNPFAGSGFDTSLAILLNGVTSTAGFVLVQTDGSTNVTEGAVADTYTLKLNSEPLSTVTVNLSFDASQITVNGASADVQLTFDNVCPGATCWNSARTISVAAVSNTAIESTTQTVAINHGVITADANYSALSPGPVNVVVTDSAFTWSQTTNPSGSQDIITSLAIDASHVYTVGVDDTLGQNRWRIEKRDITSGALVSGFGTGGVVISAPSTGNDRVRDIVQDANYIYVSGLDRGGATGDSRARLEKRDKTTGALVTAFGTGGVAISDVNTNGEEFRSLAINATHIFAAGFDTPTPSNNQWRIEKRDIVTGALVPAFGTGGVVQFDPAGTRDDFVNKIVLDGTDLYLAGQDFSLGVANTRWRIEKRNANTGALDAAFGTGGIIFVNPSAFNDQLFAIAVDATHVYFAGHDQSPGPGNQQWRIEKRLKTTGTLDTAFNTTGIIVFDFPGGTPDVARDIAVDGNRLYVAGTDTVPGYLQWSVRVYDAGTGALDTTFNSTGTLQVDGGAGGNAMEFGLALDTNYMYLGGSDGALGAGNRRWKVQRRVKSNGGFAF